MSITLLRTIITTSITTNILKENATTTVTTSTPRSSTFYNTFYTTATTVINQYIIPIFRSSNDPNDDYKYLLVLNEFIRLFAYGNTLHNDDDGFVYELIEKIFRYEPTTSGDDAATNICAYMWLLGNTLMAYKNLIGSNGKLLLLLSSLLLIIILLITSLLLLKLLL